MRSLQEIQDKFSMDRFATDAAKITIVEAEHGYAVCHMPITEQHQNVRGTVMGGAIFTLADFCVAVAANGHAENTNTISLHADITFLNAAKGENLIAKAHCVKHGKSTTLYEVEITDERNTQVAKASVNGYVLNTPSSNNEKKS